MLLPSGKEKNIMYCHLHTQLKTYEATPKPLGLAFGGSIGNERIFIDEDFSKVTIRHHAVDKTYQHGSLIPNQQIDLAAFGNWEDSPEKMMMDMVSDPNKARREER
ncbi:unnamed protein product [Triticum turgidum subsp. durum]|uniref:TLDc domain-containing protein n=1 Tax=Triticum turgidum subsp. durum TaxID=4567 RepID=A0A9R1P5M8_TRITD|nr:unnamed protein product [Triticum turgidum subsp. durum]